MNTLKRLNDYGQVIWLDFLSRRFIADGSLKRLIDEDGLAGVTSNPSIFEKAIVSSGDYDRTSKTRRVLLERNGEWCFRREHRCPKAPVFSEPSNTTT